MSALPRDFFSMQADFGVCLLRKPIQVARGCYRGSAIGAFLFCSFLLHYFINHFPALDRWCLVTVGVHVLIWVCVQWVHRQAATITTLCLLQGGLPGPHLSWCYYDRCSYCHVQDNVIHSRFQQFFSLHTEHAPFFHWLLLVLHGIYQMLCSGHTWPGAIILLHAPSWQTKTGMEMGQSMLSMAGSIHCSWLHLLVA